MAQLIPILQVYHTVEENKQLLQFMSLFKFFKEERTCICRAKQWPTSQVCMDLKTSSLVLQYKSILVLNKKLIKFLK